MRTHSLPTNHKCNICDRVFPEAAVLAEHKLTHCKVKRGDVCVVCKLVMTSEDQFYSHSQEHGLQGSAMTCIVCRQTLSSLLELQLHGRTHFSPTSVEYTCIVCLARFDTSERLLSKVNAAGREYFVCRSCFSGGDKRLPYACSDCPLRFASQRELDAHEPAHITSYQCIKCQESFSSKAEIQVHVTSHMLHEGSEQWCKLCNQCFDSPAGLQCHLIQHTFNDGPYKCFVCGATFDVPKGLQKHMSEHSPAVARMYPCSQCKQSFFFNAELLNHIYTQHSNGLSSGGGEQRSVHACGECSETFSSVMTLNAHRKLHESFKDATLKCTRCPLIFKSFNEVQQHFKTAHNAAAAQDNDVTADGRAPSFDCVICGDKCTSLEELTNHVKAHNSGTTSVCCRDMPVQNTHDHYITVYNTAMRFTRVLEEIFCFQRRTRRAGRRAGTRVRAAGSTTAARRRTRHT